MTAAQDYQFPKRDYIYDATMVAVTDGDTVKLDLDLGLDVGVRIDCRLNGVNAKGKRTVEGKKAMAFLQELYPVGGQVRVETFRDKTEKYGRYLVVLHHERLDDTVNNVMVKQGLVEPYYGVGKTAD